MRPRWFGVMAFVLLAACDTQAPPSTSPGPLLKQACGYFSWGLSVRAQCFRLTVDGRTLPVTRLYDGLRGHSREAVVVIAGGPGQGGQTSAESVAFWREWYQQSELEFDLILYDARGTAGASDFWRCKPYEQRALQIAAENLSVEDETAQLKMPLETCLQEYARRTVPEGSDSTAQYSTAKNVSDLVVLMRELGYTGYHLWGTSYGTRVALAAADTPAVKTLLLDSVYPFAKGRSDEWPRLLYESFDIHQRYYADTAGGDYSRQYQRFAEALRKRPLQFVLERWDGSGKVTFLLNPDRLASLHFSILYNEQLLNWYYEALSFSWPEEGASPLDLRSASVEVLSEAGISEPRNLRAAQKLFWVLEDFVTSAFDPAFSTLTFVSVECHDNETVPLVPVADAFSGSIALDIDWQRLEKLDACNSPLFASVEKIHDAPYSAKPSLVLAGELDPVTPAYWATELVEALDHAYAERVPGIGHAVLASDVCDWGDIQAFWATGALPESPLCDAPTNVD